MDELVKQGIALQKSGTTQLFDSLNGVSFLEVEYKSPKEYVKKYWTSLVKSNQYTLYGNIFEYIIYTLLYRESIRPFYTHAKIANAPLISFDTLLFSQSELVSLSLSHHSREHYKQEDLESIALKYVCGKSKCYLLTMDSKEALRQKERIHIGDFLGIDEVIDCNTSDIDDLISDLKKNHFFLSKNKGIDVVRGNLVI